MLSLILIFLTISPSFASSIVFGQQIKATCETIDKEEKNWSAVAYCSKPLEVENKVGGVQNFPNNRDDWTEKQIYLDNLCWLAYSGELKSDTPRTGIGSKSFYGESVTIKGLEFSLGCALGRPLYVDVYENILHFWFKGLDNSDHFFVTFSTEGGAIDELTCDLGRYSITDGWREYNVNLTKDCTWLREKKPVDTIYFLLSNSYSGYTAGYIDNLYVKNQPVQIDNQYYVYVSNPTVDIPVELKVEGIDTNDPSFGFEYLNPNMARWDSTQKKFIMSSNGTFIIRHSSGNDLKLTLSSGRDSDKKIRIQSTDKCSPLVEYMVYEQEIARQMYLRSLNVPSPLEAFGGIIFAGFGAVFSQFSTASKNGEVTINIPQLILKAAQDEFGADNVIVQPGGSLGHVWTGSDNFPISRLSDVEVEFYFDNSVFTNINNMEYRVWSRFENYAKSSGLNVVLNYIENIPGDPSSRELTGLKIVMPDGKVIPYCQMGSSYRIFGDDIVFGRGNFFGNDNALEKLAAGMDRYTIDDIKTGINQEYLNGLSESSTFSQKNEIEWVDDAHNFYDTPAKAYKKLTLNSKIKGDSIEIQNLLMEKYEYWDNVFRNEYKSTGSLSGETLQRFRSSFDVVYDDFVPVDSAELESWIIKNINVVDVGDGHKIYLLKNEVLDIETYKTFISEVMTGYDNLITYSKTKSGILDYIEDFNKRLNENIDNKNIDGLEGLKIEISSFKNLIPDGMENRDVMIRTLNANMEAITTAIGTNAEITPDFEIKIHSANALTYVTVFEGRLKIGDDIGNIKTELDNKNYETSQKAETEVDENFHEYKNSVEATGSTVDDTSQKAEISALAKNGESVLGGKGLDDAIEPKSRVLEKFGEYFSGTVGQITLSVGLLSIFSIGPLAREYAYKHGDMLALTAANVIQIGGYFAVASVFIGQYAVTGSFWQAIISSIALLAEPMNILGSGTGTLGLGMSLNGFVIFLLVSIAVNYIWCNFIDPTSIACGCSVNPTYGKSQLRLEKKIVSNGETINFAVYGLQHCGGFLGLSNYWGMVRSTSWPYYTYGQCGIDECCCNNSFTVSVDPGNYQIRADVFNIPSRLIISSLASDPQTLTVCPAGYGGDPNKNGCVQCYGYYDHNGIYHSSLCEEGCGSSEECDEIPPNSLKGYPDNYNPTFPGSDLISANQMRQCDSNCIPSVKYDSYIEEVTVDGNNVYGLVPYGRYIQVVTKVNNTGTLPQTSWYVGVEFWKVSDFTLLTSGVWWDSDYYRTQRVNAGFSGSDKISSCGISGCGCSYSDPDDNGIFEPGETITVTCWAPSTYWGVTHDNERIMFWIHEKDLSQDAGNNGNSGLDWWNDALSRSYRPGIDEPIVGGPADVRVSILPRTDNCWSTDETLNYQKGDDPKNNGTTFYSGNSKEDYCDRSSNNHTLNEVYCPLPSSTTYAVKSIDCSQFGLSYGCWDRTLRKNENQVVMTRCWPCADVTNGTTGFVDGIVNMRDIHYMIACFNQHGVVVDKYSSPSPNWEGCKIADVNNPPDNVINMRDINMAIFQFNYFCSR